MTLPKKGNLTKCSNWGGITILSTPSKVMGNIRTRRLKATVDTKIRKEQAGFRIGKRSTNQIFILRNIINSVSNKMHHSTSDSLISKRLLIAYTERHYGKSLVKSP